jgi:small subunit ribosomal protein S14
MARTALKVKTLRKKLLLKKQKESGDTLTFPTKVYNRCRLCGRKGGYMRKFDMCRICFRELASQGKIPGVRKSSW